MATPELQLALGHVRLGVRLTYFLAGPGIVYALISPHPAHQTALLALFASALVIGAFVSRLELRPVLTSRWREPFWVAWSASYLVVIAVASILDGGVGSPLAALFVVPVVYAALAYELTSVWIVSAIGLGLYAVVAVPTTPSDQVPHALYLAVVLGATVGLCLDYARRQDAQRRALQLSEERYRGMALQDPLTGLPNRRAFLERLDGLLAARRAADIAVLLLDLDDFKFVNDSLGHETGDEMLRSLGARLGRAVRGGDMVARLGGDEFIVLCEGVDGADSAEVLAARLSVAWEQPFQLAGRPHYTKASVGIALAAPDRDADAEQLMREADAAMYRAKDRRSGWALFHEDMQSQALNHLRVESELRRALDRGELRLAYQPIVRTDSGVAVGVEALLRWEHPERGLLGPFEFLDVAERSGLIVPVGRWVLAEACRQVAVWNRGRGDQPLHLTVNVSAAQIASDTLEADVTGALLASGLPPTLLGLEITEHALIDNPDEAQRLLHALRARGVRLLLDDFGTGYSSLGYLRRFRIDAVKIDRTFVSGMHENVDQHAIVEAIVRMANSLGLEVVAEGVELTEQLTALRALGGERAQGFLFSRPLLAEDFERAMLSALR
jgi:diguanylate cyclase (GGDEF)-like protein